jgi:glutamyl-tRNA synthetase/glutamyl-Q tRNA(Asp) synthetase
MTTEGRSRFAPSTTGRAHPGTLLAGLLCWLDARSRGAEVILRLEDLDAERTKPGFVDAMIDDLAWLGLDWDGIARQSESRIRHETVLDRLVEEDRVYVCECSRSQIRAAGARAPDGSHRYPGTCRARRVRRADWRGIEQPLRLRWDRVPVEVRDETGLDLSGDPAALFGDPILRRRDGAFAYHFASVVDDAAAGVDRVVRGRDLAPSTTIQVGLQQLLGFETPRYRHHCLFLENSGTKLSKLHGAVDVRALRERHGPEELCGLLVGFVGLMPRGERCRPSELVADFDWDRVSREDVLLGWSSERGLQALPRPFEAAEAVDRARENASENAQERAKGRTS